MKLYRAPTLDSKSLPWHPLLAVIVTIALYFASQIVGQIVVSIYPALHHWSLSRTTAWLSSSTYAQFFYIAVAETVTLGGLYLFLKRYKSSFKDIGLRRIRAIDPVLACIALPVYFAIYIFVLNISTKLAPSLNIDQKQQIGFDGSHTTFELLLIFISLVVLPPLAEEIMVRGFLFTSLLKKLSGIPAALITSVIFAAAHLQFGNGAPLLWVAAIDTFTLSLVLCYLRYRSGSIWAGVGLHMLKNGIAFISLFILHTV